MFIPLFRNRCALDGFSGTVLLAAKATVADGLLERVEASTSPISRAQVNAVIGPTPGMVCRCLTRFGQQRISLQRAHQRVIHSFAIAYDRLPAQLQQRPDTPLHLSGWSSVAHGNSPLCEAVVCCGSPQFPSTARTLYSSSAPFAAPINAGNAKFGGDRGSRSVTIWHSGKKVAAQAIRDLAGIDPVILLFCRRYRAQHQRMRHLHLRSVWLQMIINPSCEYRRFHGHRPGLRQSLHPLIQFRPCGLNRTFLFRCDRSHPLRNS